MTRLASHNVSSLGRHLQEYDAQLVSKTGHSLKEISLKTARLDALDFDRQVQQTQFFVVPMTSGQGVIPGFCNAVRDIISFLGGRVRKASFPDVSGFVEAFRSRADIIFCADDNDFVAINVRTNSVVHNNQATAKAYVSALMLKTQAKEGKVIILGCGYIGQAALAELNEYKQHVAVYDCDKTKTESWYKTLGDEERKYTEILSKFPTSFKPYKAIIDATPAANIIDKEHIHQDLTIAAPGVPLGVTSRAFEEHGNHIIHDPLQLGVATMVSLSMKHATRLNIYEKNR
ncbi:MAG: 3-methylornithyl-N6-L-lysine dehydrogenase PylD [Desulfovermiculus sp.]